MSGGSIIAAWMHANRKLLFDGQSSSYVAFEEEFAGPLRAFLSQDIRTAPILRTAGRNLFWKSKRCQMVGQAIDSLLSKSGLPDGPEVGPRFRLIAFDIQHRELVELSPDPERLAMQVVASAAFPPLFGPVILNGRELVDGGLASNLGVSGETLNRWRCVLVSDAGRLSPSWTRSKMLPMSMRLLPLLKDGADRAFRSQIGAANRDDTLVGIAPLELSSWYGSNTSIPWLESPGRLAGLRTDLAGFNKRHVGALERRGTQVARALVRPAFDIWAIKSEDSALRPDQAGLRRTLATWGK